ncbi:hypothetical protein B9Z55_023999 [Caenorhabditis nigoni]|uniref:Uncharacterized protein n=1 Tax=Caenorhabditis nigoni TaxID=1611254 RepID=A0A2G5SS42_9PELO|nr:hypothetical protein B9Z55_023999 [Caenorhabditis nigoni]
MSKFYSTVMFYQQFFFSDNMAREQEQEQQDIEYENPGPNRQKGKENPVANMLIEPKQEVTDAEVKKEPTEDMPVLKEPKQEVMERPIKQEIDEYIDYGVDAGRAFNGRINYKDLDNQKGYYPGFPQIAKKRVKTEDVVSESASSDSVHPRFPRIAKSASSTRAQKRRQNATTDNGKRVKTEEFASKATSSNSIGASAKK